MTYGYLLPSGVSHTALQVKSLLHSCCCFSVDKKQLWISVFFIAILGFFCYRRSLKDLDTKVSNWHWLSLGLLTEHTWTDWRRMAKNRGTIQPVFSTNSADMENEKSSNAHPAILHFLWFFIWYVLLHFHAYKMNIVAPLKNKINLQVEGGLVERGALLQCDSYGWVTVFCISIYY